MSSNNQSERDPKRPTKNFHSALDRESLNATRDKHDELNLLIANLSDKLTIVSNSQEKEFLSAYRVHMLGVQLELKELKLKVAKAELSLQDDGEVSKLEDECNWFRTETNRLNAHCSSMQSDIQSMRNRLSTLRDQNDFLSSQLKAVMKRSRVIEVELEYNQQEREERRQILQDEEVKDDYLNEDVKLKQSRSDLLLSPVFNSNNNNNNRVLGKSESAIQLGRQSDEIIKSKKLQKLNQTSSFSGRRIRELRSPPSDILKQNNSSRRLPSNNTITAADIVKEDFMSFGLTKQEKSRIGDPVKLSNYRKQTNELLEKKSNIEIEIEKSLKVKFDEVVARRSKVVMSNSKNRYIQKIVKSVDESHHSASDNSSHMLETLDSASFNSGIPNEKTGHPIYGGVSGLGLEYFTDSDRKDIMTSLLSKPEVFDHVVNKLLSSYYSK